MTSVQLPDSCSSEFLIAHQNADGGWGFHPGTPSAVEASAWVLAALHSSGSAIVNSESCARARDWLLKAQRDDGSWPAFPGQRQGCWVTSIASQALHLQGESQPAVERGLDWLLNTWPAEGSWWWRLRQTFFPARDTRQNSSLRGWNWTPGTASWVEPTAHALLFLRSLPAAMNSPRAAKRRQLAEQMLFDRMCPGGGWNSGNPLIYGVAGVPRVGPTVWALLALRDHVDPAEIQTSLNWLEGVYATIPGAASLALAHRCLVAYGRSVPPLAPRINQLYSHNRFLGNLLTIAWIILAQNEETNAEAKAAGEGATP